MTVIILVCRPVDRIATGQNVVYSKFSYEEDFATEVTIYYHYRIMSLECLI